MARSDARMRQAAGAIANIQENVNGDSEQQHARQAGRGDGDAGIDRGHRDAAGKDGPKREERQRESVRPESPFGKTQQADKQPGAGDRNGDMRTGIAPSESAAAESEARIQETGRARQ